MTIDQIFVLALSLLAIVFVWWFFFGKREQVTEVEGRVRITVAGGYSPASIRVRKGAPVTLVFYRTDQSACLEEVVLPDFGVKKHLPVGEEVEVNITPEEVGTFTYTCGMNMYKGTIIVENRR